MCSKYPAQCYTRETGSRQETQNPKTMDSLETRQTKEFKHAESGNNKQMNRTTCSFPLLLFLILI